MTRTGAGCQQVSRQSIDGRTGTTSTINYNPDGSAVKKDVDVAGKVTTTNFDKTGKVIPSIKPQAADPANQPLKNLTRAKQQNLVGNDQQGLANDKQKMKVDVLNQIQNKPDSKGVKQDIKTDVANQIGINPSGGVQANLKSTHSEKLSILKPNQNMAVGGKTKESFYKGQITPESKFGAVPQHPISQRIFAG